MSQVSLGKEQFWSGHLSGWRSSGLSRREYCAREKLAVSTLGYWQRRLRGKAKPVEAVAGLTLVPVQVEKEKAAASWVLRSPGGWSLELPATVSAGLVAQVLKQLP